MTEFSGPTRFNHVAMSMPADSLDEAGRADICRFYSEVFGWQEHPKHDRGPQTAGYGCSLL